eukprot:GHVT01099193.1.p1 GENE.GHVT01099193.1~~GHVT01099193.1.p1  ORF type:complete len:177 (-),score=39.36 GHVT01099193.1:301-831(-)
MHQRHRLRRNNEGAPDHPGRLLFGGTAAPGAANESFSSRAKSMPSSTARPRWPMMINPAADGVASFCKMPAGADLHLGGSASASNLPPPGIKDALQPAGANLAHFPFERFDRLPPPVRRFAEQWQGCLPPFVRLLMGTSPHGSASDLPAAQEARGEASNGYCLHAPMSLFNKSAQV